MSCYKNQFWGQKTGNCNFVHYLDSEQIKKNLWYAHATWMEFTELGKYSVCCEVSENKSRILYLLK